MGGFPKGRHLFCFGCGYSASRLARRFIAAGSTVSGTSRSAEGAEALRAEGIHAHVFDGSAPLSKDAFAGVTDILSSIPPGKGGDDGIFTLHGDYLAGSPTLKWAGLLSTTGVYGDAGGEWITENFPRNPKTERSQWRVDGEDAWLAWGKAHGVAVQIFRLPGIYGPGRSNFARLRAGTARRIIKPGQVFNRIHTDDIGSAVLLGMQNPDAGPDFHLADGHPAPADQVMAHAAEMIGMTPPPAIPIEEAGLPPMALQFYDECKRLDTTRARQELGFEPAYPSYVEGLEAVLAEETG